MLKFLQIAPCWLLACKVTLASRSVSIDHLPSQCLQTNRGTIENVSSSHAPSSNWFVKSYTRTSRTPPTWNFQDQFEFYGFWLSNEMNVVRRAFLGVIDLLTTTMKILGGNPWDSQASGTTDPSFLRYFNPGDLNTFGAILQRLLAVLGAPNTEGIRRCIEATKLQLVYGDGKDGGRRCIDDTSGVYAYYNAYYDANGNIRSYLAFCPRFFSNFRSYDEVQRVKLGSSIDIANPTVFSEAETGTAIALHELLHWLDPFQAVLPEQISDLKVVRPDDKSQRTAYRSFYAMHVKDWSSGQSPLQNADSYVFCVLYVKSLDGPTILDFKPNLYREIFYRDRFALPPWEDSPDPHALVEGPDGGPS